MRAPERLRQCLSRGQPREIPRLHLNRASLRHARNAPNHPPIYRRQCNIVRHDQKHANMRYFSGTAGFWRNLPPFVLRVQDGVDSGNLVALEP